MNIVKVRNVSIGEGMPKICVPLVGTAQSDIIEEAKSLHQFPVDIVEWRTDWFEDVFDHRKVIEVLRQLREILGDIPILFTFRTSTEGGNTKIDLESYVELNKIAAASKLIDLLDIELFLGDAVAVDLIEEAHKYGVKTIISNHDFFQTPTKEEIIRRLCKMQDLGGDIPKIAVTPTSKSDVLTLLSATVEMNDLYANQPIITMSMAGMGVISRISGELFGSAVTFGAVSKASAPGQVPVKELQSFLNILHNSI